MTLPNFVVIGAAKSGTTSLRDYLEQHPEVFVTKRGEPSFFAHAGETLTFSGPGDDDWTHSFVTDLRAYERLFDGAASCPAIGEISPRYLYFEKSALRMHTHVSEARILAILRHPVDRAYSHFLMNKGRNCEPAPNLPAAIAEEAERAARGWGWDWRYVGAGLYHHQLTRYYERFPRERIKVFLYDDYRHNPDQFFHELFTFLGVDSSFRPDTSVKRREAALPRSHYLSVALERSNRLSRLVKHVVPVTWRAATKARLASLNTRRPEPLSAEVRQQLFDEYFAADCARLEPLIGRDVSSWATHQARAGCHRERRR